MNMYVLNFNNKHVAIEKRPYSGTLFLTETPLRETQSNGFQFPIVFALIPSSLS